MIGGPETPLSRGDADMPLEQAVSPADLLNTSLEDQSIGLGPDMGRTPQNMMDDGRGAYDTATTGAPPEQLPPPGSENQAGVVPPPGPAPQAPPVEPVVGQEQPQNDQGGVRTKSTLRYNEAEFNPNYRYTQRDFYPDRPQFVTTDAVGERMQLASAGEIPYAVLASRKQALQSKRESLNQKKAALLGNDYGNTAPQYQQEYAKYASESQQKLISDVANSFDGDRSAALEYLTNTQEGQRLWAEHNRNVQAVGTEVKDMVEVAEDRLINHGKRLISLNEEELKYARDLVGGYRSLGTDKEVDLNELIKNSRYLNQYMGRDKYMKEYGTDFVKNFAQTTKGIDPENPPYWSQGKLFIPVTERTTYDGLIENMSRSMTQMNMFKDVNEAKDWLKNMMPPDVKTEYKVVNKDKAGGGGGGSKNAYKGVVRLVSASVANEDDGYMEPGSGKLGKRESREQMGIRPYRMVSNEWRPIPSMVLNVDGKTEELKNPTFGWDESKKNFYISGNDIGETEEVVTKKDGESSGGRKLSGTGSESGKQTISKNKESARKYALFSDNGDAAEVSFGTRDPYEVMSKVLVEKGLSADIFDAETLRNTWDNKLVRDKVISKMK
jgi:hypothetical protein